MKNYKTIHISKLKISSKIGWTSKQPKKHSALFTMLHLTEMSRFARCCWRKEPTSMSWISTAWTAFTLHRRAINPYLCIIFIRYWTWTLTSAIIVAAHRFIGPSSRAQSWLWFTFLLGSPWINFLTETTRDTQQCTWLSKLQISWRIRERSVFSFIMARVQPFSTKMATHL